MEDALSNPTFKEPPVHAEQVIEKNSAACSDDVSSQLYDLANSSLEECQGGASISDLDTAIYQFHKALDQRSAPHPMRSHSLKNLAEALLIRFSLINQLQDLDQAISLLSEMVPELSDILTGKKDFQLSTDSCAEQDSTFPENRDNSEVSDLIKLAKATLANFNQSARLSSLDTAIMLHRTALHLRPSPHPKRLDSLGSMAASLFVRFRRTNDMPGLDEAISVLREAVGACEESKTRRANFLGQLSTMLAIRFDKTGRHLDLTEAVMRYRDIHQPTGANDGETASQLLCLAANYFHQFKHTGQIIDLETAISLFYEGRALLPACHSLPASYNLAMALLTRFQQSGHHEDLDKAISFHREALELRPAPHPLRCSSLNILSVMLRTRFEHSGQCEDLDEAVSFARAVVQLQPVPHPDRSGSLDNLGFTLTTRFEQSGKHEDLHEAISLHRESLNLLPEPHPLRSGSLNNLANGLWTRFKQSGQHEDLEEAVFLHRDALKLRSAPHADRSSSLTNLAVALMGQFEQSGQREYLNEAILFHREAIELQPALHPDRSSSLSNLATAIHAQFKQSGKREDLDEAICLQQEALKLVPAPHPDRFMSLNNLGNLLITRFERLGQHEDLDEAVLFQREALELRPMPHPLRSNLLNNIATALLMRFNQLGQRNDLDEAISFYRAALELQSAPHSDLSSSLGNLAVALATRFEQLGQRRDIDEAISFHREALKLQPTAHLDQSSSLNNLAVALRTRFRQSGQREDLDEAISLYQEALRLRPARHADRSSPLNNLAVVLTTRFEQSGQYEDIEKAISLQREALELRLAPHPKRSMSLNNLANSLISRFERSRQRKDLDEAIKVCCQALNALVSGHPSICQISTNLGRALVNMYFYTHESQYLDEAMAAFQVAVTCKAAPASVRFQTAKLWALYADSGHISALDAYKAAIELLPRLAMLGLDLPARQQALTSGSDGLARDAAACAIRSGQYERAVELLEEGRAVFWSQALQLRTPMNDLRDVAPKLEGKLRHISFALEQGSLRDVSRTLSDTPHEIISVEKEASHFHDLDDEWLATLEEVRQLDGFRDFLRPSRLSTLRHAADDGSVVILNASKTGCAALILTLTGVQHVPLPRSTFAEMTVLVELLQNAVSSDARCSSLPESAHACVEHLVRQMPTHSDTLQSLRLPLERHLGRASDTSLQPDDIFRYALGVLWESVVEPVIHVLGLKKTNTPTRLWWCPTGPFAFLPIHAAGIYLTQKTESVSDYVVSSYTPTIGSILGNIPVPTEAFKMMVVIQPETPGQKSLPGTIEELQKIKARVPNENLVKLTPGSVNEVILHLSTASIAHFACHGQQNTQNPLESALFLQDGHLKVSQIMQQSMPNASLAFLSACETAMGDENLPDEAIHIGSTLLFAGFRGVVATMWSIADTDGPKVADTFYEDLFKNHGSVTSIPNTSQAAQALHLAVSNLRVKGVSFVRWVPFIHLGK